MGAHTGYIGRVQGGSPGLPYHDPLFGLGDHGGEGNQILWGPLPGVPGCHPGGLTDPPDIKFCGRCDFLPLGWAHIG